MSVWFTLPYIVLCYCALKFSSFLTHSHAFIIYRWHNHLDPNINKAPWTQEEDSLIMELYHEFGSQWNRIASSLEGRTDNSVKNHFNSSLKKLYGSAYLGVVPSTPVKRRASIHNRTERRIQIRNSQVTNGETIICQPELSHLMKSSSSSGTG